MFVGITNTPRDYAWGSTTAIAELLGREPSGAPEAELWLGTHPGSPSQIVGRNATLRDLVDSRLPFLMKIIAAAQPLSLQAHPNTRQAEMGFEWEERAGIPLAAPERNYQDKFPKPELIYALSDPFRALCGFREVAETRQLLTALAGDPRVAVLLDRLTDNSDLREVFQWLIENSAEVGELTSALIEHKGDGDMWDAVRWLQRFYPGDPGVSISILLNAVTLRPGEALFVPTRTIHSYLEGLGIELMAASDNVLRGGLTSKHVDALSLFDIVDFSPQQAKPLQSKVFSPGIRVFSPDQADFTLIALDGAVLNARIPLESPAVYLCTAGTFIAKGRGSSFEISSGQSYFSTAEETQVEVSGNGIMFVAVDGWQG
jgi:mannose-6-phosphate isomerase